MAEYADEDEERYELENVGNLRESSERPSEQLASYAAEDEERYGEEVSEHLRESSEQPSEQPASHANKNGSNLRGETRNDFGKPIEEWSDMTPSIIDE
jgi:hypothetical protein